MEVELPPRDRPRPVSPVPEDSSCLAYELTPPEDPLPFEASFDERVTYARLHRAAHLRAAASLHCSIVAWTGLWDLVTYCGLAFVWRESVSRNIFLIVVGGLGQWYLDVLNSNALVPGSGDGGFPDHSWRRALGSFASQTMCTAGLYNLMDDRLPRTAARDAYLAILGLVVAAFIDTLFAYSEMRARQDSAYARAAAAATCELGSAPIRSTRRAQWDLRLGGREPRPRLVLAIALVSHVAQVCIWIGFDNLWNYWPYSGSDLDDHAGDCFWGCRLGRREWYDQLPAVAIGLLLMLFTGTLLHFGFAVDRLDPDAFPHVRAWLEPPSGEPSASRLVLAFLRSVVAMSAYYSHLSAFWYLVDEDCAGVVGGPDSAARNVVYVVLGLAALYATGCFWNDTM